LNSQAFRGFKLAYEFFPLGNTVDKPFGGMKKAPVDLLVTLEILDLETFHEFVSHLCHVQMIESHITRVF